MLSNDIDIKANFHVFDIGIELNIIDMYTVISLKFNHNKFRVYYIEKIKNISVN